MGKIHIISALRLGLRRKVGKVEQQMKDSLNGNYSCHNRAAKAAITNTVNNTNVKSLAAERGASLKNLMPRIEHLLQEGVLTPDTLLDNMQKVLLINRCSLFVGRVWLSVCVSPCLDCWEDCAAQLLLQTSGA